jgi:hypothetical protein
VTEQVLGAQGLSDPVAPVLVATVAEIRGGAKIKETGCLDESSEFVLYCCKQPRTCAVMLQYIELFLLSAAIVALFRKFWV